MNLLEFEGKQLFQNYGIPIPKGRLISKTVKKAPFTPAVLKSQVLAGDRGRKGGIKVIQKSSEFATASKAIWNTEINSLVPEKILIEELIDGAIERYVSISYDSALRVPVLAVNAKGGSGTAKAAITPIDPIEGLQPYLVRAALVDAKLPISSPTVKVILAMWKLFQKEHATLVEINPLFELKDKTVVAGDAKIILDDNAVRPDFRPYVDMGGDIAVLASGGGASMINLDALMQAGGRPANYVEYSGNPKSDVVKKLTQKVLARKGLKGLWVVGGTANFTDIYETLLGFAEGLKDIKPKPTYPIVIRRDGPRQKEAFVMLEKFAKENGFDMHLYGPETPMSESAKKVVQLAYS